MGAVQNSALHLCYAKRHGFSFVSTPGSRNKRIGISVDASPKKCSAYGADIFTPHLPQAASSPQAPQGEDKWGAAKNFATHYRVA